MVDLVLGGIVLGGLLTAWIAALAAFLGVGRLAAPSAFPSPATAP